MTNTKKLNGKKKRKDSAENVPPEGNVKKDWLLEQQLEAEGKPETSGLISGGKNPAVAREDFLIEELADGYRLFNVPSSEITMPEFKGKPLVVEISKSLLGRPETQPRHMKNQNQGDYGRWKVGAGDVWYLSTEALVKHYRGEGVPEEQKALAGTLLSLLKQDYKRYWMTTSTRIYNREKNFALVKHDWMTPQERVAGADLVGDSGYLSRIQDEPIAASLSGLFGETDLRRVRSTYKDPVIAGEEPFLWRFFRYSNINTALLIGFSGERFDIVNNLSDGTVWPARGLVAERSLDFQKK